jgi:hypothetical protein
MELINYLQQNNNLSLKNDTIIAKTKIGHSILRDLIFYFKKDIILKNGFHSKFIPGNIEKITLKNTFLKNKKTFQIPEKFQQQVLVYPITCENYNFIKEKFKNITIAKINTEDIDKICLNLSLIDFDFESYDAHIDKSFIKKLYKEKNLEYIEIPFKIISFKDFIESYFTELYSIYNYA